MVPLLHEWKATATPSHLARASSHLAMVTPQHDVISSVPLVLYHAQKASTAVRPWICRTGADRQIIASTIQPRNTEIDLLL